MEQCGGKQDRLGRLIKLPPTFILYEAFNDHPGMGENVSLGMMDRVLWARSQAFQPIEMVKQRTPIQ